MESDDAINLGKYLVDYDFVESVGGKLGKNQPNIDSEEVGEPHAGAGGHLLLLQEADRS